MTTENYAKEIRDFIINNFLFGEAGQLQDDSSFMEQGILDSTGILELVTHLEQSYHFKVADGEMLPENLDSINRAAAFVARKVADRPASAA